MLTSPNATTSSAMTKRLYVVSTSDRIVFKRCRRRWDFQSRNRQSLTPIEGVVAAPLWQGSGHHFALEDFHGYNVFGHPVKAFEAYIESHRRSELPDDYREVADLEIGMLNYYADDWLVAHPDPLKTLWIDDVPQVEVNVLVPLGIQPPPGFDEVVYSVTYDRVGIDEHGRLVIVDYKTAAKAYEAGRLELDPQVSSYIWSGRLVYGDSLEGAQWVIFLKAVPDEPLILKSGELSQNKNQYTTYRIYKKALLEYYGEIPNSYKEFLNHLAAQEDETGDRYVKRDTIYRNEVFAENEERKIFAEIHDMIDPNLSLYPNPTRDCSWDCQFRAPCLSMDDGSDYSYMLESEYERWEGEGYKSNEWRKRLKYPEPLEVVV